MRIACSRIVRTAVCACAVLVLAGVVLKSSVARAAWPDHTVTIIVPFPPGGPNDLLGRLLAAELAPKLGQNVIVENRAGAVGNIGLAAGARAAPDGYTLVVVTCVVLINPSVTKVTYDPLKDFAPIAYLGAAPNAIITRPARLRPRALIRRTFTRGVARSCRHRAGVRRFRPWIPSPSGPPATSSP